MIVTAGDGVFPLVAAAEGKKPYAGALLRTGAGSAPDPGFGRPRELDGRVGTVDSFVAADTVQLPGGRPEVNLVAVLGGGMMSYDWTINGRPRRHPRPAARTPSSFSRGERSPWTSSPTIPATGCCTATRPTTKNQE